MVAAEEKAVVAVMDNEAHFNITRGATFDSIEFRGDYGMLNADATYDAKANIKYCEVDESQNLFAYDYIKLIASSPDDKYRQCE